MSASARLKRLFSPQGKCFDVAIDHGFFNEASFLPGIEDIQESVEIIVKANPDAVQLSPGQARFLQAIPGKQKPSLVLRTDVSNIYGTLPAQYYFSELMEGAVETAVRLDAACVVVNLFLMPNQPELYHACLRNISRLRPDCVRLGMPLMIEPLVLKPNDQAGGYMVDGDLGRIVPLVRQAAELGADVIKADPCDDVSEYHKVIEAASGVPLLVRGGGRASDEKILSRTVALMEQGAKGIVYGRNVVQHAHPGRMTEALMAIVHRGATAEQAQAILQGKS